MKLSTVVKPLLRTRSLALCLLTLAGLLAGCGNQSGPSSDTQNDDASGERLEALLHGPVESAYLEPLTKTMNMTIYDGSQKPEDFDLLIFDGDAHSAADLKSDSLVAQALRSNKLVMGVDLNEKHKKEGLGHILNASSCGDSPVYAMHMFQDRNGRQVVRIMQDKGQITDAMTSAETGTSGPPALPQPQPAPCDAAVGGQGIRSQASSDAFTKLLLSRIRSAKDTGIEPLDDSPPSIPADLIYTTYKFTDTKSLVNDCSLRGYCNKGPQTSVLQVNYTYTIFLNNQNNAQGDFQYVLGQTDVTTTAAADGRYVNMFGQDGTDWTCCSYDEESNFVGGFGIGTTPGGDTGDAWVMQATSPETVNNVTQVTNGYSFTIGFQGQDPSASFTYSDSITQNISDWKEDNNSVGNNPVWYYRSAYPFVMDVGFGCAGDVNDPQTIWGLGCYLASKVADLSLYTAQFRTTALWKTPALQNEPAYLYNHIWMRVVALACVKNAGLLCEENNTSYADVVLDDNYEINMGAVVPIPIKSLTFNPGASVKGGTTVTGTLALAEPAVVDTTINLTSDEDNASVPPSVTIKQGQTSADFQILTNANGIAPGGQLVATIKAFYTEFFQAQLTLTN